MQLRKIIYFIFGGSRSLLLYAALFSCNKQGPFLGAWASQCVASLVPENGLQICRLQQLQHMGSVFVAPKLQSTDSVVVAHGPICTGACGHLNSWTRNPTHVSCIDRFPITGPLGKFPSISFLSEFLDESTHVRFMKGQEI